MSIKRFSIRRIFSKELISILLIEINRVLTDDHNYTILEDLNYSEDDLRLSKSVTDAWKRKKDKVAKDAIWFVPCFLKPFAGMNNILSIASYLQSRGITQKFALIGDEEVCNLCEINFRKGEYGANLENVKIYKNPDLRHLAHADITFATRWDTAFYVLKFNNTNAKFYFIQDDERLLFPGTIFRDLVECTYRFGFIGITNALELKYMYNKEFSGQVGYFSPAPNKAYFSINRKQKTTIDSIWFY